MAFPLFGRPKPQFFDNSSAYLAGGLLYIRDPDDNSLKTTYPTSDNADNDINANANPIVLDARGQADIWARDGERYKYTLTTPEGTTLEAGDNLVGAQVPYVTLRSFGARSDGSNASDAVDDAVASGIKNVVYDSNTYVVSDYTAFTLPGNYTGTGIIQTSDGPRGNNIIRIDSQPTTFANGNGLNSFYTNGITSPWNFDIAVTGADTLGQPTSGYLQSDQTTPIFIGMYNSSGYNNSVSDSDGRTGVHAIRLRVTQNGDGDCGAINANCIITNNNSAHTGLYGTPAGILLNGNISTSVSQVYLNPLEFNLQDLNNDVRAVGGVFNLERQNTTEGNDEYWSGIRVQSTFSEINAGYQLVGPAQVGLDLTLSTIGNAGIAMKDSQFIHFDSSATTLGTTQRVADTFPGTRIGFETDALNTYYEGSLKWAVGTENTTNYNTLISTSTVRPDADGSAALGANDIRWATVHTQNVTFDTDGNVRIQAGTGTPEGVVTASVGALYLRTDGGAGTTLYVKESGLATNTGWAAV